MAPPIQVLKLLALSLLMFLLLFKIVELAMEIELVVVFQIGRLTSF
jgi:hypothetical protein